MSQVYGNGVDSPDWVGGPNQGQGTLIDALSATITPTTPAAYGPFYVGNIPYIRFQADSTPSAGQGITFQVYWYATSSFGTPIATGPTWTWNGAGRFLQVAPTLGPWCVVEVLGSGSGTITYDLVLTACVPGVSDQAFPGAVMLQTTNLNVAAGASLNFVPQLWIPGNGTMAWLGDLNTRININLGTPASPGGSIYQCFTPPPPPYSNSQPFTFPQQPWYVNFLNSDTVTRVMGFAALSGS